MADPTREDQIVVGSRVYLKPDHNWLTRYAPLAEHKRPGTVTNLPDERTAEVIFDTNRPGAIPITGRFFRGDLMLCSIPKREQADLFQIVPSGDTNAE